MWIRVYHRHAQDPQSIKNLNKSALETKSEISIINIGHTTCTEHRKWEEFME